MSWIVAFSIAFAVFCLTIALSRKGKEKKTRVPIFFQTKEIKKDDNFFN